MERLMKNVLNIVGILIVVGSIAAYFINQRKVDEYNDYIYKLRPIIKAQDVVIKQITSSTIANAAPKLEEWRSKLRGQLRKTKAIMPKKQQIQEIHAYWVKRTQHLVDGIEALKEYIRTRHPKHLKARTHHFNQATKALKSFIKRRDRYFKRNNIRLKEQN
jgi:hypothetical protein